MGIIEGFLGGGAHAMATAGQMMLGNKLAMERDEANFLRDSELRQSMQGAGFKHAETMQAGSQTHAETLQKDRFGHTETLQEKRIEAEKGRTESIIGSRESEGEANRKATSTEKELDRQSALKIAGIRSAKNSRPQLIKYTDNKGNEQEGVLHTNTDGTYTIVKPQSDQILEREITSKELKDMAAQLNVSENRTDDWIPWNEYNKNDPEVRVAVQDQHKKEAKGGGGGIVNNQATMTEAQSGEKSVNGKPMTKEAFVAAMVGRYGEEKMADIEKAWLSIK